MPGDSYTLREVSELLGLSKRTLQRRIREGAFPGRFLAPGRHGLETRIPAEELHRALKDLRRWDREPAPLFPTVSPDQTFDDSLVPYTVPEESTAMTQLDLESLRAAMVAIVREDRERVVLELKELITARDRELGMIRSQLSTLQRSMDELAKRLEDGAPGPKPPVPDARLPWATEGSAEVESLLRELEEIEALVGSLGN